jgi:hypothetical protein
MFASLFPVNQGYSTEARSRKILRVNAEGDDHNTDQLIEHVIVPRITTIIYHYGNNKRAALHAMPIGNTYIMFPRHLLLYNNQIVTGGELEVFMGTKSTDNTRQVSARVFFDQKNLVVVNSDTVIYNFGKSFQQYKDIVHHFISEQDIKYLPDNARVNLLLTRDGFAQIVETTAKPAVNVDYVVGDQTVNMMIGMSYRANTRIGDCGALLLHHDPTVKGKIIGFHIAADNYSTKGYSILITREQIEKAILGFPKIAQGLPLCLNDFEHHPYSNYDYGDDFKVEGNFLHIGKLLNQPPRHAQSKLRPSVLHGVYPITKIPANLKFDMANPVMSIVTSAFGHRPPPIPDLAVRFARD